MDFSLSSQGLYQGSFGYHLAINGKSFAALCDYFPEHLPKVSCIIIVAGISNNSWPC